MTGEVPGGELGLLQAAVDLLVVGLQHSACDLGKMYLGEVEGSESLASCDYRHYSALLAVARGSVALVTTTHAQWVDLVGRLGDASVPGWNCSGSTPSFYDFERGGADDGDADASGSLPRVHTLTLARAERVLSAMPEAEALLGWQKDSGLKSFVDDPDYNSAADDDFVDRGGPLESYNSKLSTLIELTKETKKLVQRMRTPPTLAGICVRGHQGCKH